jgi:hypothetical protein
VFLVIIAFLAVSGLAEFYGIVEKRDLVCFKGWGIAGGLLLIVGTFSQFDGSARPFGFTRSSERF